ncbi:MAG: hypothetical protein PUG07_08205 [Ruminococcus sp.]|uniref:hypothetical protein n=1 Tax=Blautia massiliensis (ex Durand et al. 2017) TaxID=1737424 RepID=UPI0024326AA0|nr:hypothetical protein [Blautia massiliensis (ex Durand et al. 2017)]MDD6375756.1 hypothetical protein [Ruminococcus sp.]MDD6549440.1 hypothetical protein [Blautia massiliensis (ex Durand et al. 2017)]
MPKKKQYQTEREGQMDFFDNYRIPYDEDNSVLVDNTDGIWHGNLLEFKLHINNTGKVLFQAVKYLSKMRIKGESVPATILLVDLNDTKVYVYHSVDYLSDIQQVYVGAASVGNDAFSRNVTPIAEYDYSEMVDSAVVQQLLINRPDKPNEAKGETEELKRNEKWYIPIDINEDCVVGWAERYYREIPKATKGDFLGDGTGKINLKGEIREPKHFAGLINPYEGKTNDKFVYLMDCLNSRLAKKDLGAFYTPMPYARKAAELVQQAVERVPNGNDYIILDRCAGTGNLESALIGLKDKNGDELVSHCVVSTYEYYEYKVLLERIGDKVRNVIPPTEANIVFENGNVSNADAMSEEYINNPLIKRYVDNEYCTIILFENPPYGEATTVQTHKNNNDFRSSFKTTYIVDELKKEVKGVASNDFTNAFIWSGFKYYLRQDTDSYIVFSPMKYWKLHHLVNKKSVDGFVFNRKHFHASPSAVGCVFFENVDTVEQEMNLTIYDINNVQDIVKVDTFVLKKTNSLPSALYDKRSFPDDVESTVVCGFDGTEDSTKKVSLKPIYNDNILGYLIATGATFENPRLTLNMMRVPIYNGHGFYLRKDNYMEKLPLFAAGKFPVEDNWYWNGMIYKSTDKGDSFKADKVFLKSCLIFTCLTYYNKCMSFTGSDGRYYRNELCFDTTNGDTVASADLATMTLDAESKKLMALWDNILSEAKKTANYNPKLTYGVYQITKELNTFHKEGSGKKQQTVYDYPNLNGYLTTLRDDLKKYYKTHITEKMFKYELLK